MFLAKAADKIVLNILNKIDYGYLELTTYDGKIFQFGEPSHYLKANLIINNPNFNYNLIKSGSVGLAECYMRNEFQTANLSNLIELTARNIKLIHKFAGILDIPVINFIKNKIIKNTKNRSKENISKHYDLGNEFFSLWLDETLTYSSAIFDDEKKNYLMHKIINIKN